MTRPRSRPPPHTRSLSARPLESVTRPLVITEALISGDCTLEPCHQLHFTSNWPVSVAQITASRPSPSSSPSCDVVGLVDRSHFVEFAIFRPIFEEDDVLWRTLSLPLLGAHERSSILAPLSQGYPLRWVPESNKKEISRT